MAMTTICDRDNNDERRATYMATMREKVTFKPNEPQTVTIRYPEGKIVSGRFGEQVMYSLEGNQVMFLDLGVAQKINLLEPQPGESICICKRWNGEKSQPVRWDVWLSPETEKMRAARQNAVIDGGAAPESKPALGSELVDQLRASVTHVNQRRYNTLEIPIEGNSGASGATPAPAVATENAYVNGRLSNGNGTRSSGLVAEANVLVDAFAEVLERALTPDQGRVKPEEVRSLLLSAYIQRGKAANYAA